MNLNEAKEIVLNAAEKSAQLDTPEGIETVYAVTLLREWYKKTVIIDPIKKLHEGIN
jgi:hypothetical protein